MINKIGIKTKISILMSILIITSTLILLFYIIIPQYRKDMINQFINRGMLLSNTLETTDKLIIKTIFEDKLDKEVLLGPTPEMFTLNDQLMSIQNNNSDDIKDIFILDSNNNLIAHSNAKEAALHQLDKYKYNMAVLDVIIDTSDFSISSVTQENIKYWLFNKKMRKESGDKKIIGSLFIAFKLSYLETVIYNITRNIAIQTLVILGIGIILTFFAIKYLLKPIDILIKGTRIIGSGNLEYHIPIQRYDEIGKLSDAFNNMTSELSDAQKKIIEKEKLEQQIGIARDIQLSILPKRYRLPKHFDVKYLFKPAYGVAGDYYDIIRINPQKFIIVVGDVSGKGIPASLVMTMTRAILHSVVEKDLPAAEILKRANKILYKDIKPGMFVTMFLGIIDSKEMSLNYANAGHNPIIIYNPTTNYFFSDKSEGMGLGPAPAEIFDEDIEDINYKINKGDFIIEYSDGITEAMNEKGEEFGIDNLIKLIKTFDGNTNENLVRSIEDEVKKWAGDAEQNDDITVLSTHCLSEV